MAYQHGVRVQEQATSIVAPILGTAGLQVVFGTAPVNLADDPYSVTNTPVIAYSWSEAVGKLVAERAKAKGIETVVFDRGGYLYHGRVKALAEGAREGGLQF